MNDTLQQAAREIENIAHELRQCHTVNGTWDGSEPEAQAEYERLLKLSQQLKRQQPTRQQMQHAINLFESEWIGQEPAQLWSWAFNTAMREGQHESE